MVIPFFWVFVQGTMVLNVHILMTIVTGKCKNVFNNKALNHMTFKERLFCLYRQNMVSGSAQENFTTHLNN